MPLPGPRRPSLGIVKKFRPWELSPLESPHLVELVPKGEPVQFTFKGCESAVDKFLLQKVFTQSSVNSHEVHALAHIGGDDLEYRRRVQGRA